MKEEVLLEMKNELLMKKNDIALFNLKVSRIRELMNDPKVYEYVSLVQSISGNPRNLYFDEVNELKAIYNRYSSKINEDYSNGIYVYLGTFSELGDSEYHDRVDYNSKDATYRLYQDIERTKPIRVLIKNSKKFESENLVIKPKCYSKIEEYNKIQNDFFIESMRSGQEYAKKYILNKYKY